jgi:hypothetical protein
MLFAGYKIDLQLPPFEFHNNHKLLNRNDLTFANKGGRATDVAPGALRRELGYDSIMGEFE